MMTTAVAATSLPDVEGTLNLVVAGAGGNKLEEQSQRRPSSEQVIFVDEIDKEKLELNSDESAVPYWSATLRESEKVFTSKRNKMDEENMEKFLKERTPPVEVPAFDFTKIETLFPNQTTASGTVRSESKLAVQEEGYDIPKEQKKKLYSLNGSLRVKELSVSSSNDENKSKRSSRNGITKNRKNDKQKKPNRKAKNKDTTSGNPSISPLERPATPLTPSLDLELLRQFEEEDRPKRVLRSSTAAASMAKNNGNNMKAFSIINETISGSEKKKPVKQSISKKPTRKIKKQLPNFASYAVPIVEQQSGKHKRKRRRSDSDLDRSQSIKRLKTGLDALLDEELLASLDDLKNIPEQQQCRWSASTSNASCCSIPSLKKVEKLESPDILTTKTRRTRRATRVQMATINSNWKMIGPGFKNYIYINNDTAPVKHICYQQAQHSKTGDYLRLRDAVRVNSIDGEPNFGCIARLFKDTKTGMPLATVLWYYSPRQVKVDGALISPPVAERELLASRHIDVISLDTIDEIIRVLTYNEYARFMAETTNDAYPRAQRVSEDDLMWRKGEDDYPRRQFLPCDDTPLELVYFCRRVYDFKQHRVTNSRPASFRKLSGKRSSHRCSCKH